MSDANIAPEKVPDLHTEAECGVECDLPKEVGTPEHMADDFQIVTNGFTLPESLPEVADEEETTIILSREEASKVFPELFPKNRGYLPPNPRDHPLWKRVEMDSKGKPMINLKRFKRVTWVEITLRPRAGAFESEFIHGAAVRHELDGENTNVAWAQAVWNALEHHQSKIDAARERRRQKKAKADRSGF